MCIRDRSPTGHELEIIPLSDISRFSEDVKLKVLYKTYPLAGAIMELDSVSYLKSSRHTHAVEHQHPVHKAELTFVTNEDGIVTVPSLHIGQWLAKEMCIRDRCYTVHLILTRVLKITLAGYLF